MDNDSKKTDKMIINHTSDAMHFLSQFGKLIDRNLFEEFNFQMEVPSFRDGPDYAYSRWNYVLYKDRFHEKPFKEKSSQNIEFIFIDPSINFTHIGKDLEEEKNRVVLITYHNLWKNKLDTLEIYKNRITPSMIRIEEIVAQFPTIDDNLIIVAKKFSSIKLVELDIGTDSCLKYARKNVMNASTYRLPVPMTELEKYNNFFSELNNEFKQMYFAIRDL